MMKNSTYFSVLDTAKRPGTYIHRPYIYEHLLTLIYKVILYRVIECISFLFLLFLLLYHRIDFLDLIPTFVFIFVFFHF